jgi:hypothetical protein
MQFTIKEDSFEKFNKVAGIALLGMTVFGLGYYFFHSKPTQTAQVTPAVITTASTSEVFEVTEHLPTDKLSVDLRRFNELYQ